MYVHFSVFLSLELAVASWMQLMKLTHCCVSPASSVTKLEWMLHGLKHGTYQRDEKSRAHIGKHHAPVSICPPPAPGPRSEWKLSALIKAGIGDSLQRWRLTDLLPERDRAFGNSADAGEGPGGGGGSQQVRQARPRGSLRKTHVLRRGWAAAWGMRGTWNRIKTISAPGQWHSTTVCMTNTLPLSLGLRCCILNLLHFHLNVYIIQNPGTSVKLLYNITIQGHKTKSKVKYFNTFILYIGALINIAICHNCITAWCRITDLFLWYRFVQC